MNKWTKLTEVGETANNQDPAAIAKITQDLLMKQSKSFSQSVRCE